MATINSSIIFYIFSKNRIDLKNNKKPASPAISNVIVIDF